MNGQQWRVIRRSLCFHVENWLPVLSCSYIVLEARSLCSMLHMQFERQKHDLWKLPATPFHGLSLWGSLMAQSSTLAKPPTLYAGGFFFLTTEVIFSHFHIWAIVSSDKVICLGNIWFCQAHLCSQSSLSIPDTIQTTWGTRPDSLLYNPLPR